MLDEARRSPRDHKNALGLVDNRWSTSRAGRLWGIVIATDVLALLAGWFLPTLAACWGGCSGDQVSTLALSLVMVPLTMILLAVGNAYGPRAWMLYSIEMTLLNKAVLRSAIVFYLLQVSLTGILTPWEALWRGALVIGILSLFRRLRRRWLSAQRRRGRYITPVLLVGSGGESEELFHLFKDHPEIGYSVKGLIPSGPRLSPWSEGLRTFPAGHDCLAAARACGATAVLIDADALDTLDLQGAVSELAASGMQVRLAGGFEGWGSGMRKTVPLAYESLYEVVPTEPAAWQLAAKRSIDLLLGGAALLVALPVLAAAILAVRIFDGSPVFLRQKRVGRSGRLFTMLKLRTMVVDAEERIAEVLPMNVREGPLFKADADPRITPLGRFLRAASIDEIPQLLNVVRGDMSLVGPRPSLPDESRSFDGILRLRETVPPGLSGLWQVEARDLPSFRAYRRLDLYYVRNWSLSLDIAILMVTPVVVAARAGRAAWRYLPGRSARSPALLD